MANDIAASLAVDRAWRSPAAVLAVAENYLAQLTPAIAAERFHAILPDDHLHVILSAQTAPAGGAREHVVGAGCHHLPGREAHGGIEIALDGEIADCGLKCLGAQRDIGERILG